MNFKEFTRQVAVYHGSKNPIEKLDPTKHQSGYYPGFYTFIDPEYSKTFGNYLYQLHINPDEFFTMTDGDMLKQEAQQAGFRVSGGSGYGEVQYLKSQGYKGIKRGKEFIIFDPQKITLISEP